MQVHETAMQSRTLTDVQKPPTKLRRGSFSEGEAFFLRKLLLDANPVFGPDGPASDQPKRTLDDEVLLSVPLMHDTPAPAPTRPSISAKLPSSHQKAKRRSIKGLWEAHASGVNPKSLTRRGSLTLSGSSPELRQLIEEEEEAARKAVTEQLAKRQSLTAEDDDDDDALSDQEVRPEKKAADEISVASSWDEEDDHKMFNTWEVRYLSFFPLSIMRINFAHTCSLTVTGAER